MEPLELATLAAKALDNKKAQELKLLKVFDLTVLADYFVIATGTSTTHVGSLADEVEFELEKQGIAAARKEGGDSRTWVLLDYGSVIVHVFTPDARDFYSLERLWADAEPVVLKLEA